MHGHTTRPTVAACTILLLLVSVVSKAVKLFAQHAYHSTADAKEAGDVESCWPLLVAGDVISCSFVLLTVTFS